MKNFILGYKRPCWLALRTSIAFLSCLFLSGCFEPLYPKDGELKASIRYTTNGVPHIKAGDLTSAAFGAGYAQAKDNVCLLAEAFVKARSERAKYFGPGPDNMNVISDFSFKAQGVIGGAREDYSTLSWRNRALIDGFTAGYNKYVEDTPASDFPAECRDQPWVKSIEPADLIAYYRIIGQYASGALFASGATFLAVPPGVSPAPVPAMAGTALDYDAQRVAGGANALPSLRASLETGLASNAWAIGRDMTEQGRGALLSNPHFPYTGHRRLYQMQMTVPGYLNINGAGLLGTAIPLINFNKNLAWSHTNSASRRFTFYELTLKSGDDLTYIKDGEEKPITTKTFEIEVANGTPTPMVLERTFYYSEYGPMISANAVTGGGLPKWGGTNAQGATVAYTYRDANGDTSDLLGTWLEMSRASNLKEFQHVFRGCGSTLWTNTIYTDDRGNAFYIDSSSVPNLSAETLAVIEAKRNASPAYNALFQAGLTLLDGSTSRDDWVKGKCDGLVPYESMPKLLRTDWVQNSNDSHWATNPDQFLTGYSPLYGPEQSPLGPRTRLGIKMLQNPLEHGLDPSTPAPGGQDGRFSARELTGVIWNNRAWYSEQYLGELLNRCEAIAGNPVNVPDEILPTNPDLDGGPRTVSDGCAALASWNGTYDLNSVGAHVFRAFNDVYLRSFPDDLQTPFNPANPVYTPADPSNDQAGTPDDPMLQSLAAGLIVLDAAGIDPAAALGDVQYYQPTGGVPPGGDPSGVVELSPEIPWHGGDADIDGAFNATDVADSPYAEDTVIPRENTPAFRDAAGNRFAGGLSANAGEGWNVSQGSTWIVGLEFTDNGPEAFGLLSYSQSTDPMSPYFIDQSYRYSEKDYREILFTEDEIMANLLPQGEVTISSELLSDED
ncbi:acylase [Marinobacter nanhaiticus D15-8W]|uniref:Penicillin acylase family protein n=1 Tax=Marinobacter nanhaiticus D15-8W TaxID=626887 RepID=N6WR59_9GAMM|nr:penicillin acylase family protein [Marinobacter nanhaiticus]ENO13542.1 penicillin acylase family protein [Marinobacter nanhaiticus D15-8W]BES70911.1 acylase [Marinobacter nanhaiticus D15-8W]